MKKIIFLLVAFFAMSFAQSSAQVLLKADNYIWEYTGLASDTVSANDVIWTKSIQLNKVDGLYYNAKVKVSDVTANSQCRVIMQQKIFDSDTYAAIDSITWYGGGTDTTLVFTHNTNKTYHRNLRFVVRYIANKPKITYIGLSLKK